MTEVEYSARRLADGTDFRTITSKAYVPSLQLVDGRCLTEFIAILDYIDFQVPDAGLLGERRAAQRQMALEWLGFVATEIHKSFSPLFRLGTPAAFFESGRDHLESRLSVLEDWLSKSTYLAGKTPSAADFYLFTLCLWIDDMGMCLRDWPNISKHSALIKFHSTVQSALASEKLCTEFNKPNSKLSG